MVRYGIIIFLFIYVFRFIASIWYIMILNHERDTATGFHYVTKPALTDIHFCNILFNYFLMC